MTDKVTELPVNPIPETTIAAQTDPGWIAASLYVMEIANQVFGGYALVSAVPDPDGFYQSQAGKAEPKPGIYVELSSIEVEGLAATLVVPYEASSFSEIRFVMSDMLGMLRKAELSAKPQSKLIVPEKKLYVPK